MGIEASTLTRFVTTCYFKLYLLQVKGCKFWYDYQHKNQVLKSCLPFTLYCMPWKLCFGKL